MWSLKIFDWSLNIVRLWIYMLMWWVLRRFGVGFFELGCVIDCGLYLMGFCGVILVVIIINFIRVFM